MKLGVSYIVFDGAELLEYSIKQIRRHVDFLQVIYQDQSWFGHPEVFENVVECLTGDSEITTNVLDGLKVVEIIEKIYSLKK